jgi:hypothetical protein
VIGEILSLTPINLLVREPEARSLEMTIEKSFNIGGNFS